MEQERTSSFLVVIVNLNPFVEANGAGKVEKILDALMVFVRAFLLTDTNNQVALIANDCGRAFFLYCPKPKNGGKTLVQQPTFAEVKQDLVQNLKTHHSSITRNLQDDGTERTTLGSLSSALSMALCLINRFSILPVEHIVAKPETNMLFATSASEAGSGAGTTTDQSQKPKQKRVFDESRILVIQTEEDISSQYTAVMNSIFAAQKLGTFIDSLVIGIESPFLQMSSFLTEGSYLAIDHNPNGSAVGVLEHMFLRFLADVRSRKLLCAITQDTVDFQGQCFCCLKRQSIGFTCNVCLSVFCPATASNLKICPTCETPFSNLKSSSSSSSSSQI